MPRIRSIRPETWSDKVFTTLSLPARYLYIAMWTWADDEGRGRLIPKEIEGYAFPHDDLSTWGVNINGLITELAKAKRIVTYTESGNTYYTIPSFERHQKPRKPTPSRLPAPPDRSLPAPRLPSGLALADSPVFLVLEHHFGEATLPGTRNEYQRFINDVVARSGFHNDVVGAKETERRILNMKVAHADNVRAWTLTNLTRKWDLWSIDNRPVTQRAVSAAQRRQEVKEALDDQG